MSMFGNRWRRAQMAHRAMAEFYLRRVDLKRRVVADTERKQSLAKICQYTSLLEDDLHSMRILEIGGTLIETAFDSPNTAPKLVLDPLLLAPRTFGKHDKTCHRVRGVGEFIPQADKSVDLVWCENTLDHTASPSAVSREIRRVLAGDGLLVISCNIFPICLRWLFPLLNILDKPHPHHFTLRTLRSLLRRDFEIQKEIRIESKLSIRLNRKVSLFGNLKTKAALILGMKYLYFRCIPKAT